VKVKENTGNSHTAE